MIKITLICTRVIYSNYLYLYQTNLTQNVYAYLNQTAGIIIFKVFVHIVVSNEPTSKISEAIYVIPEQEPHPGISANSVNITDATTILYGKRTNANADDAHQSTEILLAAKTIRAEKIG